MFIRREHSMPKYRIIEIDFLRGFLIMFMIIDHIFFDFWDVVPYFFKMDSNLYKLKDFAMNYWNWDVRIGVRFLVLALFFIISGICCYFSKNNLKRGLILFFVGTLISIGFLIYSKITKNDSYIFFGAISCFGFSILIYGLLKWLFYKFNYKYKSDFKWIVLSLGLIILALGIIFDVWNVKNQGPNREPLTKNNWFLIIIGKVQHNGVDWLPLCPYLGLLFIGSFLGEIFYNDKKSYFKLLPNKPLKEDKANRKILYYSCIFPYKGVKNVLTFTGKYSLFFYLLHQVALILIIFLILILMGYKLVLPI